MRRGRRAQQSQYRELHAELLEPRLLLATTTGIAGTLFYPTIADDGTTETLAPIRDAKISVYDTTDRVALTTGPHSPATTATSASTPTQ
jgi:hypothetical protein